MWFWFPDRPTDFGADLGLLWAKRKLKIFILVKISLKSDKNWGRYSQFNIRNINTAYKLNQRTSGPVNAHLTPDTWSWYIFKCFYACIYYSYSPGAWTDNPLGTNADVNRKPLSLCSFVASFKTISFVTLIICCKFLPLNDFPTVFPI